MGPGSSAVSDTARAPKKKVLTLKERVESPYFEDYSCPWLQDVWIQLRDNCEKPKKIREAIATATPASMKSFHFLWNIFLSCVENAAFMWVHDCLKKGTTMDFTMIWEKARSLYNT